MSKYTAPAPYRYNYNRMSIGSSCARSIAIYEEKKHVNYISSNTRSVSCAPGATFRLSGNCGTFNRSNEGTKRNETKRKEKTEHGMNQRSLGNSSRAINARAAASLALSWARRRRPRRQKKSDSYGYYFQLGVGRVLHSTRSRERREERKRERETAAPAARWWPTRHVILPKCLPRWSSHALFLSVSRFTKKKTFLRNDDDADDESYRGRCGRARGKVDYTGKRVCPLRGRNSVHETGVLYNRGRRIARARASSA